MTLSALVATVAQLLILAIIVRAILSWFVGSRPLKPIMVFLSQATDPILVPIQRRLRPVGSFDFSPIVAIFLITIVESLVLRLLAGY